MTVLAAIVILGLAAGPLAFAGSGGGRKGGAKATSGQRQGSGQGAQQSGASRQGNRARVEATQQQQQQVRACTRAAERVRVQAREMAKSTRGTGAAGNPPQQHRQLQDRVRTMEQEHDRLMQSLNDRQRAQVQDRIQEMTLARNRVRSEMQQLGRLVEGADPEPARVRDHAREIERASKTWEKQYRRIESDMTSSGA